MPNYPRLSGIANKAAAPLPSVEPMSLDDATKEAESERDAATIPMSLDDATKEAESERDTATIPVPQPQPITSVPEHTGVDVAGMLPDDIRPSTIQEQTSLGTVSPRPIDRIQMSEDERSIMGEIELLETSQGRKTGAEQRAYEELMAMRKTGPQGGSASRLTPAWTAGKVAAVIKQGAEPGSMREEAITALTPKYYGSGRGHYYQVAQTDGQRVIARDLKRNAYLNGGMDAETAELRARNEYDTGAPLLLPTDENPDLQDAESRDPGVNRVPIRNSLSQSISDQAVGIAEGIRSIGTGLKWLTEGILVSKPPETLPELAIPIPIGGDNLAARWTAWNIPSPSEAARDWLRKSDNPYALAIAEHLDQSIKRDAGVLLGWAEGYNTLGNAVLPKAAAEWTNLDPNDIDGPIDALVQIATGKYDAPPRMPAEQVVNETLNRFAAFPGTTGESYSDLLSGKRAPADIVFSQTAALGQLFSTPFMSLMGGLSTDVEGRETAAGWAFRVPVTVASSPLTTWGARIADYAAVNWLGATSYRRHRGPIEEDMTFAEAFVPPLFTGSGLHDTLRTIYNGDSITPEYLRLANTVAYGMPGLSPEWRRRIQAGGTLRDAGLQVAMAGDMFLHLDSGPHYAMRGMRGAASFINGYTAGRAGGMSPGQSLAFGGGTVAPSLTHRAMMNDPKYKAVWETTRQDLLEQQRVALRGQGRPESEAVDSLRPDRDAVQLAMARAYARRAIDAGANPMDAAGPGRASKNVAQRVREDATTLRIRPDEETVAAERVETKAANPVTKLTADGLTKLGYGSDDIGHMSEGEGRRRVDEGIMNGDVDGSMLDPERPPMIPAIERAAESLRHVAAAEDLPPPTAWTEEVSKEADPARQVGLALSQLATYWKLPLDSALVFRAFQTALSFYDRNSGKYRRNPMPSPEWVAERIAAGHFSHIVAALNLLRRATPEQVWRNVGDFERGETVSWTNDVEMAGRANQVSQTIPKGPNDAQLRALLPANHPIVKALGKSGSEGSFATVFQRLGDAGREWLVDAGESLRDSRKSWQSVADQAKKFYTDRAIPAGLDPVVAPDADLRVLLDSLVGKVEGRDVAVLADLRSRLNGRQTEIVRAQGVLDAAVGWLGRRMEEARPKTPHGKGKVSSRQQVRSDLMAMVKNKLVTATAKDVDIFLTIFDRVAERLVKLNLLETADEWWASFDVMAGDVDAVGALKQDAPFAPIFYSTLRRAVESIKQERMTAAQLRGMLSKTPGVKADEIVWTRLDTFLADHPKPTKVEVLAWLDENAVVVEEQVFGNVEVDKWITGGGSKQGTRSPVPQFPQFTFLGGTNYREILFKTPSTDRARSVYEADRLNRGMDDTLSWDNLGTERRAAEARRFNVSPSYRAPHFGKIGGDNLLAHVRMSDRVGPNGEKILHVEEVQSDWHQAGRDRGYALPDTAENRAEYDRLGKAHEAASQAAFEHPDDASLQRALADARSAYDEFSTQLYPERREGRVPAAPFSKTWHELVMKRVLREAAEGGYAGVAWTTGAQQVARYQNATRSVVDEIRYRRVGTPEWYPKNDGGLWADIGNLHRALIARGPSSGWIADGGTVTGRLSGEFKTMEEAKAAMEAALIGVTTITGFKNGSEVYRATLPQGKIAEVIGKGMAAKIAESAKTSGSLTGSDLTVGGEGMKGFYDQIIPSFLNNYTKKWGGRVANTTITTAPTKTERVHYIAITTPMREAILTVGQPLFQGAKGSILFLNDGRTLVALAKTGDISTLFHEGAHRLRRLLPAEHMAVIDAFVKERWKDGWDAVDERGVKVAEEWFARQFESVLTEGRIRITVGDPLTPGGRWIVRVNRALRLAADILVAIYKGLPIEIAPIMRKWMADFMGGEVRRDRAADIKGSHVEIDELSVEQLMRVEHDADQATEAAQAHIEKREAMVGTRRTQAERHRDLLLREYPDFVKAIEAVERGEELVHPMGRVQDVRPIVRSDAPTSPEEKRSIMLREGWGPRTLEEAAADAERIRAIVDPKEQNGAIQDWLSAIHAVLGTPKKDGAMRHKIAVREGMALVDQLLAAGRLIVGDMTDAERLEADARPLPEKVISPQVPLPTTKTPDAQDVVPSEVVVSEPSPDVDAAAEPEVVVKPVALAQPTKAQKALDKVGRSFIERMRYHGANTKESGGNVIKAMAKRVAELNGEPPPESGMEYLGQSASVFLGGINIAMRELTDKKLGKNGTKAREREAHVLLDAFYRRTVGLVEPPVEQARPIPELPEALREVPPLQVAEVPPGMTVEQLVNTDMPTRGSPWMDVDGSPRIMTDEKGFPYRYRIDRLPLADMFTSHTPAPSLAPRPGYDQRAQAREDGPSRVEKIERTAATYNSESGTRPTGDTPTIGTKTAWFWEVPTDHPDYAAIKPFIRKHPITGHDGVYMICAGNGRTLAELELVRLGNAGHEPHKSLLAVFRQRTDAWSRGLGMGPAGGEDSMVRILEGATYDEALRFAQNSQGVPSVAVAESALIVGFSRRLRSKYPQLRIEVADIPPLWNASTLQDFMSQSPELWAVLQEDGYTPEDWTSDLKERFPKALGRVLGVFAAIMPERIMDAAQQGGNRLVNAVAMAGPAVAHMIDQFHNLDAIQAADIEGALADGLLLHLKALQVEKNPPKTPKDIARFADERRNQLFLIAGVKPIAVSQMSFSLAMAIRRLVEPGGASGFGLSSLFRGVEKAVTESLQITFMRDNKDPIAVLVDTLAGLDAVREAGAPFPPTHGEAIEYARQLASDAIEANQAHRAVVVEPPGFDVVQESMGAPPIAEEPHRKAPTISKMVIEDTEKTENIEEIKDFMVGMTTDQEGMVKMFSDQLYEGEIAPVATKELLQNAFDGTKEAIQEGLADVGRIYIRINKADRTIEVIDNGVGMSAKTVSDAFFRMAKSEKNLPPEERSGGFGIAKVQFMASTEWIELETVHNGISTTLRATPEEVLPLDKKVLAHPERVAPRAVKDSSTGIVSLADRARQIVDEPSARDFAHQVINIDVDPLSRMPTLRFDLVHELMDAAKPTKLDPYGAQHFKESIQQQLNDGRWIMWNSVVSLIRRGAKDWVLDESAIRVPVAAIMMLSDGYERADETTWYGSAPSLEDYQAAAALIAERVKTPGVPVPPPDIVSMGHGTRVKVKIPKTRIKDGEDRDISFYADNLVKRPLGYPIFGNVIVAVEKVGDVPTLLPYGKLNTDMPAQVGSVQFDWGRANVYAKPENHPNSPSVVLSSGIYQFDQRFPGKNLGSLLPYHFVVDIKSAVAARTASYPFMHSREGFSGKVKDDVTKLLRVLAEREDRVNTGREMDAYSKIKQVGRRDVMERSTDALVMVEAALAPQTEAGAFQHINAFDPAEPFTIRISDGKVVSGFELLDEAHTQQTDKIIDVVSKLHDDVPFYNSTDFDMTKVEGTPTSPALLMAEFAEAVGALLGDPELRELVEEVGHAHSISTITTDFRTGVGLDQGWYGVNLTLPDRKAQVVLLNPLVAPSYSNTPARAARLMVTTCLHEAAHGISRGHGLDFLASLQGIIATYFNDAEHVQRITDIFTRHWATLTKLREAFKNAHNIGATIPGEKHATTTAGAEGGVGRAGRDVRVFSEAEERPHLERSVRGDAFTAAVDDAGADRSRGTEGSKVEVDQVGPTRHRPADTSDILYQHKDYVQALAPEVPGSRAAGMPRHEPIVAGRIVHTMDPGLDAQIWFEAGTSTPYGKKVAKMRAVSQLTREQLNLALGFVADQRTYDARDLAERMWARAIVAPLQATSWRSDYRPTPGRIAIPRQRLAAVRARVMVVMGDVPKEVAAAMKARTPSTAKPMLGEYAEVPLQLTTPSAQKLRAILDYLDVTGWADSLAIHIRNLTVPEIAAKLTEQEYAEIVGAVHDSVSGAAPFRQRPDQFALAANFVWHWFQRPGSPFTPAPLDATAPAWRKALNVGVSAFGGAILNTAWTVLPNEAWMPDMPPHIRVIFDRFRRDIGSMPVRLAEHIESAATVKGPGALVAAIQSITDELPGFIPHIEVGNHVNPGGLSDLAALRQWIYDTVPGTSFGAPKWEAHDLRRADMNWDEVYQHTDLIVRVLSGGGRRRMDGLTIRLIEGLRNHTLTEFEASDVIGKMHSALNAAHRIGVNILTSVAGQSGADNAVAKRIAGTPKFQGLAIDAYEAFYKSQWKRDPAPNASKNTVEDMVIALGLAGKETTVVTHFWLPEVLNRLNVEAKVEQFADTLVDHQYVHDITKMATSAGAVPNDFMHEVMMSRDVANEVTAAMWGTSYASWLGPDSAGEVAIPPSGTDAARGAARVIIAQSGLRPDLLIYRKGVKGEMPVSGMADALAGLSPDPAVRATQLADPATWMKVANDLSPSGRDFFASSVMAQHVAGMIERHAPIGQYLSGMLTDRKAIQMFWDRVIDLHSQLKGHLLTGGTNGIIAAAVTAGAWHAGAPLVGAAVLGGAMWAIASPMRLAGYVNNAMSAVSQGALELGWAKAIASVANPGVARLAYLASWQTVKYQKMNRAIEAAGRAVTLLRNKVAGKPTHPENIVITSPDGTVHSLAGVVQGAMEYGLDGTQARFESAERIRRSYDRMAKQYEQSGTVAGIWNMLTGFFGRYTLNENYRRMYEHVDTYFRYVWLIRGIQEGLPFDQAVKRSLRISFDYTETAPVDRLINSVFIFWMYQRRAMDLALAALIEHPHTFFGLIRVMRNQDLLSGYSDTDDDYVRQSETIPDYAMMRPGVPFVNWLPVTGVMNGAVKPLLVEPVQTTAMRVMIDAGTGDTNNIIARVTPEFQFLAQVANVNAGGNMVSFFRKREVHDSDYVIPSQLIMWDQKVTGGAFARSFGAHAAYIEDPQRRATPIAFQEWRVGDTEENHLAWDAFRSLIGGVGPLLTTMDISAKSDDLQDKATIWLLAHLEPPPVDGRFISAVDEKARPSMGPAVEYSRLFGIGLPIIPSKLSAEQAPSRAYAGALKDKRAELEQEIKVSQPKQFPAPNIGPVPINPDKPIEIDPNKAIGVER